jgi:phenylacetate-CoA ligase
VVTREGERDAMTLHVEAKQRRIAGYCRDYATLRDVTKLGGEAKLVPVGSLPNDGKVIADERSYT